MEKQLSASLGDSDMEESLLLIIHIVNLTSNLIELWLFSAALAVFALRMTGLNYSSSSQLSAHIYRPIQEQVAGLCSLLYWNSHLLHVFTHFSLYFTFIWLSSPLDFPGFLLGSYPPFILSPSQTTSALIQINSKTHLVSPFWPSICTKPVWSENGCFPKLSPK